MSLPEWQISLISASIGALIGTAIPFAYVFLREKRTEEKRKSQIRTALCSELLLAREALAEALANGKEDEKQELYVDYSLPVNESFPLNTTYYDDLTIEALATSVSNEALKSLQPTYNLMYRFNNGRRLLLNGFLIEKSRLSDLIAQIDKTMKLLNNE